MPERDGSGDVICGVCGGPAKPTEITAGGDELTPVVLCDAESCKPRKDIKLTIGEPSYGTLLTQHGIALNALRSIVRHAGMPDGESWEQAYIEVTQIARDALEAVSEPPPRRPPEDRRMPHPWKGWGW